MGRCFCSKMRDKNGRIMICRMIGIIFAGIILVLLFALAFSFLVQYLWNTVLCSLFAVKSISFWQAFGIILLAKILFGSLGKSHPASHRGHHDHMYIRNFVNDVDGKWDKYRDFWKEEGCNAWKDYILKNDHRE